jgi:membrane-bound metal-dependent hydrolase YbcI (DUF457 family)
MGAALIIKPGFNRNFSVITFGLAQIAMDIEPGIGMLTGAEVLHGPTHTILGALVIAYIVTLIAPQVSTYLLKKWNKEVHHYKLAWLVQSESVPKTALIVGAFFGTLSHLALDSLMHHDIQPFSPFSRANPLMGLLTHDAVYQLCSVGAVLGFFAWFAMQWAGRKSEITDAPAPLVIAGSEGFYIVWIQQLRFTWFWLLLLSVSPGLVFGSGIFAVGVLMTAVLIGVPALVLSLLLAKGSQWRGFRRLSVMVFVPILTLIYVFQVDGQIPTNAAPIANAIESYRGDTGHYPQSLEVLMPKHLSEIPVLKFSLIQPRITYRLTDGKPYLSIPSAAGDAFAQYEYDFDAKTWRHYS